MILSEERRHGLFLFSYVFLTKTLWNRKLAASYRIYRFRTVASIRLMRGLPVEGHWIREVLNIENASELYLCTSLSWLTFSVFILFILIPSTPKNVRGPLLIRGCVCACVPYVIRGASHNQSPKPFHWLRLLHWWIKETKKTRNLKEKRTK